MHVFLTPHRFAVRMKGRGCLRAVRLRGTARRHPLPFGSPLQAARNHRYRIIFPCVLSHVKARFSSPTLLVILAFSCYTLLSTEKKTLLSYFLVVVTMSQQ